MPILTSGPEPSFATLLSELLSESIYSYNQLAQLSGVPKRTIVNWLDGSVRRPRRWQSVARFAHALGLSADETDALLRAAGLPTLRALRVESYDPSDLALLVHWPPGAQDHRHKTAHIESDRSLLQRYCRQVIATHALLDGYFPPSAPFTFEEIFQDPEVRLLNRAAPNSLCAAQSTAQRLYTAEISPLNGAAGTNGANHLPARVSRDGTVAWSSLRDGLRRGVIVGQPGSGKRWLLRHEAVRLARAALAATDESARIPFLVSLADLSVYLTSPVMPDQVLRGLALCCTIQAVGRADSALIAALTRILVEQPQRVVLLLDGSHGLAEQPDRIAAVRRAVDLLARVTQGTILVAVPPLGYAGPPFALDGGPHEMELELAPLREISITRIVRSWYHDQPARSEAFLEVLRRSPALAAQATNPRLLHLYCGLIHRLDPKRMPQGVELQHLALEVMLQRADGAQRELSPGVAKWQVKLDLLEHLAWRMATYCGHWHWHLPGETLESLLDGLPDAHRLAETGQAAMNGHYSGVLWELSAQDGLLVKGNVPPDGLLSAVPYTFLHPAFHSYLVARYILAQVGRDGVGAPSLAELAARALYHPDWHGVVSLLVEHAATGSRPGVEALRQWLEGRLSDPSQTCRRPEQVVWLARLSAASQPETGDPAARNDRETLRHELVTVLRSTQASAPLRIEAGRLLNDLGDPRTSVMDIDSIEFVTVAAGDHVQGSDPMRDPHAHADELPAHSITLPEFRISRFPISQAQFVQFLAAQPTPYAVARYWPEAAALGDWRPGEVLHPARSYGPTGVLEPVPRWSRAPEDLGWPYHLPNHPVCGIGWYEARAFAYWLDQRWRAAGRLAADEMVDLPFEAEWEKAARGPDGRIYPWGDIFEPDRLVWEGQHLMSAAPIGAFLAGASPYGVEDMSGNLWEWTGTLYQPYPLTAANRIPLGGILRPESHVSVRGGSHFNSARNCRCARRQHGSPTSRLHVTFRLVIRQRT